MGVHIRVHNRHLNMSFVKSHLYVCRGFYNTVCASLRANESSKMAQFIAHTQGCLASSVHDDVAAH